jgi:hypothetical protein
MAPRRYAKKPTQKKNAYSRSAAKSRTMRKAYPVLNARTAGYLGIETKYTDQVLPKTAVLETLTTAIHDPSGDSLALIVQGDGPSTRDGRKCTIKSIHIKGLVGTEDPYSHPIRVIFFLDKQTNGAQATADTVLETNASPSGNWAAFRNLEYSSRYTILYDKTFTVDPTTFVNPSGLTQGDNPVKTFSFNKQLNLSVTYKDSGGHVVSITDNSLHCLAVTDTSNGGYIRYTVRTRFVG